MRLLTHLQCRLCGFDVGQLPEKEREGEEEGGRERSKKVKRVE